MAEIVERERLIARERIGATLEGKGGTAGDLCWGDRPMFPAGSAVCFRSQANDQRQRADA
jgi:hypothetical protein